MTMSGLDAALGEVYHNASLNNHSGASKCLTYLPGCIQDSGKIQSIMVSRYDYMARKN